MKETRKPPASKSLKDEYENCMIDLAWKAFCSKRFHDTAMLCTVQITIQEIKRSRGTYTTNNKSPQPSSSISHTFPSI